MKETKPIFFGGADSGLPIYIKRIFNIDQKPVRISDYKIEFGEYAIVFKLSLN